MNKKSTSKRLQILVGMSFLLIAAGFWVFPDEHEASVIHREPVPRVVTDQVMTMADHRIIRFSGIIRAADRAVLSFSIPARMAERSVEVGDPVKKGDGLARLEDWDFRHDMESAKARLNELKASLSRARRDAARMKKAYKAQAVSEENFDHARAEVKGLKAACRSAEAQLAEASRRLKEVVLRAPFDGTVTAVHGEPGEWAGPGTPVVEISGTGLLELEVEVPETVVLKLHKDKTVTISLPFAPDKIITGKISSISRSAIGSGRLFPVIVALDAAEGLYAGMTAVAEIPLDAGAALTVPIAAIINPGSTRPAVFCIRDGLARRVTVRLGHFTGERITVYGPLDAGENVVTGGHTLLMNGDAVEAAL